MNISKMNRVIIVGAGLAGSEAAWQAARRGARVTLYEMRPVESTPAHKTGSFAELVCSNSLRAAGFFMNTPLSAEVTHFEPGLRTPRIVMHV